MNGHVNLKVELVLFRVNYLLAIKKLVIPYWS
jgi:hypothetical protein